MILIYRKRSKKSLKKRIINENTNTISKIDLPIHLKQTGLDEFQKAAVEDNLNQLIITAGPGSGKTTVLTQRIAYLINEQNILPENCLAITFTRRAAEEMRNRLNSILSDNADKLSIHTFHSLCLSILKDNYEKAGLKEDFAVFSENSGRFDCLFQV